MNRTPKARPAGWRSELLYALLGSLETLWLTPWFRVLLPGARALAGAQILLFVAANVFGALLIIRLLTRRGAAAGVTPIALLVGVLVAEFLTLRYALPLDTLSAEPPLFAVGKLFFPPAFLTLALVALLWLRGLQIGTITVTPARASYALRLGIVFEIAAAFVPKAGIQRTVLLLLPLFFFVGLLATAQARSASLRINRAGQRSSFDLGWMGFTALLGAALSFIGFIAALLLAGFQFDGILAILGQVLSGFLLIAATLLLPIFTILATLINSVLGLFGGKIASLNLDQLPGTLDKLVGPQNPTAKQALAYLPAFCLGIVLLVALIVMLIVARNRSRAALRDGEERESLDNAAIWHSVRATLQRGLNRLRDVLDGLPRFGDGAAAFKIRRLYARLCGLAAQRGYPRAPAQTPQEYQAAILKAYPDFADEIMLLTRAYIDVHYGELPDDPNVITLARTALEKMAAQPAP